MSNERIQKNLTKESIFIIGYISSVEGRKVKIKVNKNKNSSHLLYEGKILKNVSVGGFVKIMKGFVEIIGKVEGEFTTIEKVFNREYNKEEQKIIRYLDVTLFGHFDGEKFEQGIKEMPLIDNKCYLLDKEEFNTLHQFYKTGEQKILLGQLTEEPSQDIEVSVNNLFASHIGIFGNTGSGKSNTLARMYHELFKLYRDNLQFKENSKFVIFDFNGEYSKETKGKDKDEILTENKHVYFLDTKKELNNIETNKKIPLKEEDLMNVELISILSNATDKTQRPFISRTIDFYRKVHKQKDEYGNVNDPLIFFKNILKKRLIDILLMVDQEKSHILIDYFKIIINVSDIDFVSVPKWQNTLHYFISPTTTTSPTKQISDKEIKNLELYKRIAKYSFPKNAISKLIHFLYLQIIFDIYNDKAQNEHIAPAINKLKSKQKDIEKIIDTESNNSFFSTNNNLVILNLKKTNIEIKKTLPLIIAKKLYEEHKNDYEGKSLHMIVDEAHNILSSTSERESETWKDYRLETFEEIIKEGRKFNVFLTIASQRPYDISSTIISQIHNFFIHKLMNNFDIDAINKTVSYLDKLSFDSLSMLSTGSCFFAGVAVKIPVKISINLLDKRYRPNSGTINLEEIWDDTQHLI